MAELESLRVERTISTTDTDKFREAICSFANDMPNSGQTGYLLIGVDDKTGRPSGLTVSDNLLQQLASYASDGTILPPPALVAYKHTLTSGLVTLLSSRSSRTICRRLLQGSHLHPCRPAQGHGERGSGKHSH